MTLRTKIRQKKNRYFRPVLLFLCIAGFLLRFLAGWQLLKNDPSVFAPLPETDMATYMKLSGDILNGNFPKVFYYQPFYYAVFLPVVQCFTGPSLFMIMLAQACCGALALWFSGLSAAMLAGKKGGLCAAALLAFAFLPILYTPYALIEISQLFWFTLLLYLTLRAWKKGGMIFWTGVGLTASAAILSRGNAWCFLPPILLAFYWGEQCLRKTAFSRKIVLLLLLCAGILLPQLPFILVNTMAKGTLSGPSTAGSAVLALGNTPEAPPGTLEYPETFEIWTKQEAERSVPLRIFDWFREEPGAFAELFFRKMFLFWNAEEIPNNIVPDLNRKKSPLLTNLPLIPTGILMVPALAMLLLTPWFGLRKKGLILAVLFLLFYQAAAAAFYILARFRLPAIGFFCILAACFLVNTASLFRWRKYGILLKRNGSALTAAALIVYPGYDFYRNYYESAVMRLVRPNGIRVSLPGGGTVSYDHGPNGLGGWNATDETDFQKTFAVRDIAPGTPVRLEIRLYREHPEAEERPTELTVNGTVCDLRFEERNPLTKHVVETVYPEDGIFHLRLRGGSARFLLDVQRDYGRTGKADGSPAYAELLVKLIRGQN